MKVIVKLKDDTIKELRTSFLNRPYVDETEPDLDFKKEVVNVTFREIARSINDSNINILDIVSISFL